ncbi:MAG TPA: efflux RND transporter periplasmic adaptor subunit [Microvirga sp.]|jgi:membrane fusion protein (multidrug efflux system)|nr:efflux RND transporter periplasmic adaptor subunit [Microvirga sp.]
MKRRIIASLVFVLSLALCGGLVWFNFFRDQMIAGFFAKMQPPAQTVSAVEVKTVTWTPGINAIGTAKAENGVELAVETGGVVKQVALKPNKQFAKGDVLVQLDDAVERADLQDAQAAVKLAEETLQRSSTLRTRGYGTEVAYDQAVAQLAAARSRIARLEAQIEQKALKAPFAGVAGIARVDLGQYVQPGTVVATFQDPSSLKVDFTIPEQMAGQVKLGQPVRFGLTEGEWTLSGRIAGMDPRVDPQTRLIAVQAVLADNREQRVLPGQFVRVRVELPRQPNVVTVPQTAVVPSLYGDYVYTVEAEEKDGATREVARQVFVKVGRREGGVSEIVSGVSAGQKVVISGQNKLQAGASVKINNTIDVSQATLTR